MKQLGGLQWNHEELIVRQVGEFESQKCKIEEGRDWNVTKPRRRFWGELHSKGGRWEAEIYSCS